MKKIIIAMETLILCALIIISAIVIIPKANTPEAESASSTFSKEPVILDFEYNPLDDLRVDNISSSQMFTYFSEVVNSAEYSSGAYIHQLVQKWQEPITYRIYGDATDEDMAVLLSFFEQLNSIYYFPGIYEVENGKEESLSIYFIDRNLFNITFGDVINNEDADGAAEYWFYTDTCEIYKGRVGYVTEASQETRSSVIIEEIVNTLGLADTYMREDSIVYQYSSDALEPSEVDWAIIKALYHPLIKAGMTPEECHNTPIFNY